MGLSSPALEWLAAQTLMAHTRMIASYTEEALVVAVRQGDSRAFQHLYRYYYKALLGAITKIVQDPIEAQDLLQETYVKVWQRFHYYGPEQGRLFTWLLKVARNTALDFVRQPKPSYSSLAAELDPVPVVLIDWSVIADGQTRQVVSQQLNPYQWQVVDLFYWHGYTHQQIAERLALPLGTVKSRIRQSLLALRPVFE